jgi:16S rRNA (adenine1518-N6/adenine1519-N6)-dimethyltransferase
MTSTSNTQTQSFLIRRFAEVGIQPNTKRGQNFLVDQNLMRLLVDAARLDKRDVVLEVGTGTGALTALMAPLAATVVTVEIDAQLAQLASEELIEFDNVRLLSQDALKNKNTFDPHVLEAIRAELAAEPGRRLKLVANLPYKVATPVLSNLLTGEPLPASMTVTIQKELADRIMARPSTKDYGALSLWVQAQCDIELVRVMAPSVFWPRPKVHSAILHITVDTARRQRLPDLAFFHEFVRAMFFHRRKFLRSELASAFKDQLEKTDADEIMRSLGLGPTTRAEELGVEMMIKLCEAVRARIDGVEDR